MPLILPCKAESPLPSLNFWVCSSDHLVLREPKVRSHQGAVLQLSSKVETQQHETYCFWGPFKWEHQRSEITQSCNMQDHWQSSCYTIPLDISAKLWGTEACNNWTFYCNNSTRHPTPRVRCQSFTHTAVLHGQLGAPDSASPDFLCSLQNALCTQHRNPLRSFPMEEKHQVPAAGIIQERLCLK